MVTPQLCSCCEDKSCGHSVNHERAHSRESTKFRFLSLEVVLYIPLVMGYIEMIKYFVFYFEVPSKGNGYTSHFP